jgi:hypothetical protein
LIRVEKYDPARHAQWDDFVARSKNGVFLFERSYMDYHADRFTDHSLLFFEEDKLLAVMPANVAGAAVASHGGLTFGGIITDGRMKTAVMLEVFTALKEYLRKAGAVELIYKAVPHIYHQMPAEEDLYALSVNGAQLFRRDVSSTISMKNRVAYSKGRKWAIQQARKHGLEVNGSDDYAAFMKIEEEVLRSKYQVSPVHSAAEITLLAGRFPERIKLFAASRKGEMLAGVLVYEHPHVAHAQYISANDEGKRTGALDLILSYMIEDYYKDKAYFDFGISTEDGGRYLNPGLIQNKESFGGRAVVHDFYRLSVGAEN